MDGDDLGDVRQSVVGLIETLGSLHGVPHAKKVANNKLSDEDSASYELDRNDSSKISLQV